MDDQLFSFNLDFFPEYLVADWHLDLDGTSNLTCWSWTSFSSNLLLQSSIAINDNFCVIAPWYYLWHLSHLFHLSNHVAFTLRICPESHFFSLSLPQSETKIRITAIAGLPASTIAHLQSILSTATRVSSVNVEGRLRQSHLKPSVFSYVRVKTRVL